MPNRRYCYEIIKVVPLGDEWRVEQWWCKCLGYDPDTGQPLKCSERDLI